MPEAHLMDVPNEGSLDSVTVPLLLAQAWRDERSGLLQLAHGKNERLISVLRGAPVSIESGHGEDAFARFLEESNSISAEDRLAVERIANERSCPQASAVLALKLLDSKALYQAMRRYARGRIAETFGWQAGHYRWTEETPSDNAASKPHDILGLLQEQLSHRWGTDRLFESILSVQDVHGDILPRFRKVAQKLAQAGDHASRVIERLDGSTPLGRVLGECAGDPLAAATLWTVLHSGVLRLTEGKPRVATEAAGLAFEVQVEVDRGSGQSGTPNAEPSRGNRKSAKADTQAAALREEVDSLLGHLGELDHYSALGLDGSANPAQIKKAYFKAAKKYHPDALARLGVEDIRDAAAQVFGRIAEAFETLSNPDKKAAYDRGGSEEPEIDTARLAQAETSFRKGEILAKMGNFDGSIEYFESAVELWPEEPAYQGGLGWALYKMQNADLDRAAQHLDIACSQAPEEAVYVLRLGIVMRAKGETNRANELIAKARKMDPDVEE